MSKLIINKLSLTHQNKKLVNLITNDNPIIIQKSIALVGQSGSGKSLTLKTILHMTPKELDVLFDYDCDFSLNSQNIGFIPQNPFTSLSPMTKIYKQFFCDNNKIDHLLKLVKVDLDLKNKFPLELSGGQLQRIVIAIALSKNPKLLLLDEPTTALDETNKNVVLNIINELQKEMDFITIFVSHDIESIKNICDEIIILKDGEICERGETEDILTNPTNNYTKMLIESNFKNREFRK
jgi:peptide/nickel transport system ATP-binding protein